jgi:hypothetical protein
MGFFQFLKKLIAPYPPARLRVNLSVQDREEIKRKWAEVEQLIKLGKPSNFKTAILEADKLLGHVLKLLGYRGQTMGDRMKSIKRDDHEKDFFDDMWQAHKVRNEMVHNVSYEVMDFEARKAIKQFERVLRELGVM